MSRKIFQEDAREAIRRGDDRFEGLVVAGIIDPAKVVRCALQNAASVSTLLLTNDVLIAKTQ